ncbi:MAG: DUF1501 domain-containing protein, partial [Planctomycetaceae bacterium]
PVVTRLEAPSSSSCSGLRTGLRLSRREVLRIGGLGGVGLTLPELFRAREAAAADGTRPTFGRAKTVIMMFLHGGHPQQETFDPKPEGPSAVRGEFSSIATSLEGVRFSEVLPRTSRWAHRMAVIRSMSHSNPSHVQACLPAQTGHVHPDEFRSRGDFPPSVTDFPPVGAVVDAVQPSVGDLPTWVRVGPLMRRSNGTVLHGQLPGLLGARHSSFVVDQSLTDPDVRIEAIRPNDDLTSIRLKGRRDLLTQFDRERGLIDDVAGARNLDGFYQRAFNLLASPRTRNAFALSSETPALRARYGQTEFGQRCLLARRLAEAGVPLVNISYCHTPSGSFDTHSKNFSKMKNSLGPTLDQSLGALIEDLDERGMLDDTLVVVNAEFGRTPKINKNSGRDHWPWVYSLALAGAGVRAGTVYGASDVSAAYPASNPHDPKDFVATLYHLLGVPPATTITDATGRPHNVIIGQPIWPLIG